MGTKGLFFPFLVAHGIIRHGSLIEKGGKGKEAPSARIHSSPPRLPLLRPREKAREHGGLGTHGDVLSTILDTSQVCLLKTLRTEYFLGFEIFIRGPLNSLVLVLSPGVYKSVAIGKHHLATSSCSSSPFLATFLAGVGCVHTTERATPPPPILMDFAAPHPTHIPTKVGPRGGMWVSAGRVTFLTWFT